jgi:S-adenosylmethionine hydrolase
MAGPLVSLLTDFGTADPWVAICKGVILSIAPEVRLLDVTHEIRAFSVRAGAFVLRAAVPALPVGVHMAVVDPGVGTERRPIGVHVARGDVLVGPDNGLLLDAADALGGIAAVHELVNPAFRRPAMSRTFHARDVFAPAAAHLVLGAPLGAFGPPVSPGALVRLPAPSVSIDRAAEILSTEVLYVDGYGNVKLANGRGALEAALGDVSPGDEVAIHWEGAEHETRWGRTFADAQIGRTVLYEDSLGLVSLAVNQGNAGALLQLPEGTRVRVSRLRHA